MMASIFFCRSCQWYILFVTVISNGWCRPIRWWYWCWFFITQIHAYLDNNENVMLYIFIGLRTITEAISYGRRMVQYLFAFVVFWLFFSFTLFFLFYFISFMRIGKNVILVCVLSLYSYGISSTLFYSLLLSFSDFNTVLY